jgi:hypothetical protein
MRDIRDNRMSEEYNDHDTYLDYNQWYDKDDRERGEERTDEDEEDGFIFFGVFSGFFDWLFK